MQAFHSFFKLHIEHILYHLTCRETACLSQFSWMRHCCYFASSSSFCTNRQHFHHARGGSSSHTEGAGRCGHPPAHTNCPFLLCCQGAVDGKGNKSWWLSCSKSTFFTTCTTNMRKGQMRNLTSECQHMYINKYIKAKGLLLSGIIIEQIYPLRYFPWLSQASQRRELSLMNEQIHSQQRYTETKRSEPFRRSI